jgi:hypothetical protein
MNGTGSEPPLCPVDDRSCSLVQRRRSLPTALRELGVLLRAGRGSRGQGE